MPGVPPMKVFTSSIDRFKLKAPLAICELPHDCRRRKISGDLARHETRAGDQALHGTRNSFVEGVECRGRNGNAACQMRRGLHRSLSQLGASAVLEVSERLAEKMLKDQFARSASILPLYLLILPLFRSRPICRSARFTKRSSSF